jgi:hypothetical protein
MSLALCLTVVYEMQQSNDVIVLVDVGPGVIHL